MWCPDFHSALERFIPPYLVQARREAVRVSSSLVSLSRSCRVHRVLLNVSAILLIAPVHASQICPATNDWIV